MAHFGAEPGPTSGKPELDHGHVSTSLDPLDSPDGGPDWAGPGRYTGWVRRKTSGAHAIVIIHVKNDLCPDVMNLA